MLAPLAATASSTPEPAPLVFILAGQSNMAGRAPVTPETPDPDVLTLTAQGSLVEATDPLGDMGGGVPTGGGVGPGIAFGRAISGLEQRPVILLQCALGGSPAIRWVRGGDLYEICLARARAALAYGSIAGVLDIQGETDAETRVDSALWASRFQSFVFGLREDLAEDVPVVFGQIGAVPLTMFPFRAVVQAEQAALSIPCASMVPTADLSRGPDGIHFTAGADQVIGERMAAAMAGLQTDCDPAFRSQPA
jgi:hypothetical protein